MINFVYVAKGEAHVEMACKSAVTVLKHHPDARVIMYLDQYYTGPIPPGPPGKNLSYYVDAIEVRMRPDLFIHSWMVTNVMCQTEWMLERGKCDDMTVFLDNDIIMRNDLYELDDPCGKDPDMCVTWRDNVGQLSDTQPYNYGVLIVKHTTAAIRAMMWLEQRVLQLHPKHQEWYGNQMALRELVGPLAKDVVTRQFGTFEIDVEQLPCHKWNWTPPDDKLKQNAKDKVFVHLKGNRKEAFDYYYNLVMKDGQSEREGGNSEAEAGKNRPGDGKRGAETAPGGGGSEDSQATG